MFGRQDDFFGFPETCATGGEINAFFTPPFPRSRLHSDEIMLPETREPHFAGLEEEGQKRWGGLYLGEAIMEPCEFKQMMARESITTCDGMAKAPDFEFHQNRPLEEFFESQSLEGDYVDSDSPHPNPKRSEALRKLGSSRPRKNSREKEPKGGKESLLSSKINKLSKLISWRESKRLTGSPKPTFPASVKQAADNSTEVTNSRDKLDFRVSKVRSYWKKSSLLIPNVFRLTFWSPEEASALFELQDMSHKELMTTGPNARIPDFEADQVSNQSSNFEGN